MSSSVQSSLIEQLQRKCRFWKRLAVTALSALALVIVFGYAYIHQQAVEYREELESRAAEEGTEEDPPNIMDMPIAPPSVPGKGK
jgi:hypothetical protein